MNPICCTALIGTYNSARTLPKTLATVRARTMPALAYVIVDCGSTDNTPACVADDAVVHRYVGAAFNDSEALNQGLDHVTCGALRAFAYDVAPESRRSLTALKLSCKHRLGRRGWGVVAPAVASLRQASHRLRG